MLFAVLGSDVGAACPDPTLPALQFSASGPDLITPQTWPVAARGSEVAPCEGWAETGIITKELGGLLPLGPTAIFDLSGMSPHILMVMAEADCDAVLAMRSGDGQWFSAKPETRAKRPFCGAHRMGPCRSGSEPATQTDARPP